MRADEATALLELLDELAPHYGDWWYTAHHGMALSENGQRDAARPKIDRSLAQNPRSLGGLALYAHFAVGGRPKRGARLHGILAHRLSA